jgi:hypothetical protein
MSEHMEYPWEDPWEGFTGQSQGDADAALITDPLIREIQKVRAERDALQAQLDSMTVEAGVKYHPSAGVVPYPGEKQARAVSAGFAGRRIMKRLVGPWVEVKGEEA